MLASLARRIAAGAIGRERLEQYLPVHPTSQELTRAWPDALQQHLKLEIILRPKGRNEYIPVIFDASTVEWKHRIPASSEQFARLVSTSRSLYFSGSQYCIQGLGLDSESSPVYIQAGKTLWTYKLAPRNAFESGDLSLLQLATDDVFHIQNLREYLLHVYTHGLLSTVTASRGGSMKTWFITSSDFEDVEEAPHLVERCKKAFWRLYHEGFVSAIEFHMLIGDDSFARGSESRWEIETVSMSSKQLVQHCNAPVHPVVRRAMDFFQNISPEFAEDTASRPELKFLWTFQHQKPAQLLLGQSSSSSSLSLETERSTSNISQLPLSTETELSISSVSQAQQCYKQFSNRTRARIQADIDEHNSSLGKRSFGLSYGECVCILCTSKQDGGDCLVSSSIAEPFHQTSSTSTRQSSSQGQMPSPKHDDAASLKRACPTSTEAPILPGIGSGSEDQNGARRVHFEDRASDSLMGTIKVDGDANDCREGSSKLPLQSWSPGTGECKKREAQTPESPSLDPKTIVDVNRTVNGSP